MIAPAAEEDGWQFGPVRAQRPLGLLPYDRWTDPDGDTIGEFYRFPSHFLVRFPDRADFEIAAGTLQVRAFPADEGLEEVTDSLFHNAIVPLIGNYRGQLHLHGSAVVIDDAAYAFMGLSRRGKTTLAGAFAAAGHPYLTEDVVVLEHRQGEPRHVQPTRPVLRLFADSAQHLLGADVEGVDDEAKSPVHADGRLPFANRSFPLAGIYLLGPGEADEVQIAALAEHAALAELMQNAFILDVEDKLRLRRHFALLAGLAAETRCYTLDFPRDYDQLPQVIGSIIAHARNERTK
ncbi:hypothetical protein [Altererythrobacter lauratis]|uniref:HprK-related kinase A n=1 Tax=Alteraurantiacibacter lauratis TaxID=2054627 RepID=A0ABV7EC10_9SPHN